jgi:hypothetical protein
VICTDPTNTGSLNIVPAGTSMEAPSKRTPIRSLRAETRHSVAKKADRAAALNSLHCGPGQTHTSVVGGCTADRPAPATCSGPRKVGSVRPQITSPAEKPRPNPLRAETAELPKYSGAAHPPGAAK